MESHGMANHVMASVVTVGWSEDSRLDQDRTQNTLTLQLRIGPAH
jgi:hypothetical protein